MNGRPSLSALVACAPLYRPSKKEKKKKKNQITSAVLETEKIQCCPSVLIWHRDVIFLSASRAGKWNKLQREGNVSLWARWGFKNHKPAKQPPTPFGLLFLLPLCIFCSCLIHICVCQHSATKEKLVISGLSIEHLVGEGNWALKMDRLKDHHLKKAWISYRSCDRDQLGLYANN